MRTIKKAIFGIVALLGFAAAALAQVRQFTIDDKTYYGTKEIPADLYGLYKYEKDKEPIVEIRAGGAGYFQLHGVPKYPVEFWVQTDENGNVQREKSEVNNNYQVVLILLYGDNGETGWKGSRKGTYDRISAALAYSLGYAIILGERFKPL